MKDILLSRDRIKRLLLLAGACLCHAAGYAQPFTIREPELQPQMQDAARQLSQQVATHLAKIDWSHVPMKATSGTATFTVPVVVHVVHNYGAELVPDSQVYNLVNAVTSYFLKTRPDTAAIIAKYKPVAANTQIAFKLATIAPDGSATKGVEHIYSYLTNTPYLDQVKIHQWPQDRYLNIWLVSETAGGSYPATFTVYPPLQASYYPYYDGMTFIATLLSPPTGFHCRPFAKFLNLPQPCGGGVCLDADGIPDTPPCDYSTYPNCSAVYTASCDTPNIQNVMINYDTCGLMFTYGQASYMQYMLQIDIGKRDSLVTTTNYTNTGMDNPMPDLLPVADFSINSNFNRFFYPGRSITFRNRSWNDTIINSAWTFGPGAAIATSTAPLYVYNQFHQPGWVTVGLTVEGNNTGSNTLIDSNALFIADSVATDANGYFQEFAPGSMDQWPVFNYYHNNFKWQAASTGYWDNNCIMYTSYDDRPFPENMAGGPTGDVDDIFSPGLNLTGFTDSCFLNFETSGATRASNAHNMHDTLEIAYSTDKALTWHTLKQITGNELANKGVVTTPYAPASVLDWVPQSISIPATIRQSYVLFRFRYHPGADSTGLSSGNNFYMDRIHFNAWPESVSEAADQGINVAVAPNPTNGSATVYMHGIPAGAQGAIEVCDITGKVVYNTSVTGNRQGAQVLIPAETIRAKGIYIVRAIMKDKVYFQRLTVF